MPIENNANMYPLGSLLYVANATKLMFAAFSMISIDMSTMMAFFLVSTPTIPMTNRIDDRIRKYSRGIIVLPPAR